MCLLNNSWALCAHEGQLSPRTIASNVSLIDFFQSFSVFKGFQPNAKLFLGRVLELYIILINEIPIISKRSTYSEAKQASA